MTDVALIMAGGRATRLGPLTAQLNKALVPIGQRPIICHQLEGLRRMGIRDVVVVVNQSSLAQVKDVVERSHAGLDLRVTYALQLKPHGPADAIRAGLDSIHHEPRSVVVLMADTFVSPGELATEHGTASWIGVAPAPETRHWCIPVNDARGYVEAEAKHGTPVCIGAYRFRDFTRLQMAARQACDEVDEGEEALMAPLLNRYGWEGTRKFKTWLDVGDVPALIKSRRQHFITRDFNHLSLDDRGLITKRGSRDDFIAESRFMQRLIGKAALLFPRVLRGFDDAYTMEFIDLPSLAELWLYWPGPPDMWRDVIDMLLARLHDDLWFSWPHPSVEHVKRRARKMYGEKLIVRFEQWQDTELKSLDELVVNGERLPAGLDVIAHLAHHLDVSVIDGVMPGTVHGDLNISNVLCSLSTGIFKLLDPRGDWGGEGPAGDIRYEAAKLRYSTRHHWAAICHGLVEADRAEGEVTLSYGPQRTAEAQAIDRCLEQHGFDLRDLAAIEASIFLSALPLHPPEQQLPLYVEGLRLAQEVLG